MPIKSECSSPESLAIGVLPRLLPPFAGLLDPSEHHHRNRIRYLEFLGGGRPLKCYWAGGSIRLLIEMESNLTRALEYTLKYWLKSFSRDQFKLQGRSVQLCNLDINGDALYASIGLPPALNVTTAKVGKLEIILPSVSNIQIEPIAVQIDRLDLVLVENDGYRFIQGLKEVRHPSVLRGVVDMDLLIRLQME